MHDLYRLSMRVARKLEPILGEFGEKQGTPWAGQGFIMVNVNGSNINRVSLSDK